MIDRVRWTLGAGASHGQDDTPLRLRATRTHRDSTTGIMTPMEDLARRAWRYLDAASRDWPEMKTVDRLRGRLRGCGRLADVVRETSHGGLVFVDPTEPRRRLIEVDRYGTLLSALTWQPTGADLERGVLRTAFGDWIGIEARADWHDLWGLSDRVCSLGRNPVWHAPEPLTVFQSLRWSAIARIPPLAAPDRLPPGAGTAVLNLIASLAEDQGIPRLRYEGPFPTEQLLCALTESFHLWAPSPDPLAALATGQLAWVPAPHERLFPGEGLCLQMRDGPEKVIFERRAYYRPQVQSLTRRERFQLHPTADSHVGGLWVLGHLVEEHFRLFPDGRLATRSTPGDTRRPSGPLRSGVRSGLAAVLRAASAPALAVDIDALIEPLTLRWASVPRDLATMTAREALFSWRLADLGAARVRGAVTAEERVLRALEVLVEMAHALADDVRRRAQASLATKPAREQLSALTRERRSSALAQAVAGGAAALAVELEALRP